MKFSKYNYREIVFTKEDLDLAKKQAQAKENYKEIEFIREVLGELGHNLSKYFISNILDILQKERITSLNPRVTIKLITDVGFIDYTYNQGHKQNMVEADYVFINTAIERNDALDKENREKSRTNLELKAKAFVQRTDGLYNAFKICPDILFTIQPNDFIQLVRKPKGFTFIWGVFFPNERSSGLAYCYLFSNEDILKMFKQDTRVKILHSISEVDKINKRTDLPKKEREIKYMTEQAKSIWSKDKIATILNNTKKYTEIEYYDDSGKPFFREVPELYSYKEEPFYKLYYELESTCYASRVKQIDSVKVKKSKEDVKTKYIYQTKKRMKTYEIFVKEMFSHFKKEIILKELLDNDTLDIFD